MLPVRVPLAALLLAAASVVPLPVMAQADQAHIALELDMRSSNGTAAVTFTVQDPGPLIRLTVDTTGLANQPSRVSTSAAWTQDGARYTAEFPGPRATLTYELDARVPAATLEGEGFTSYVGSEFAVVRMGDVLPALAFAFPENRPPQFTFTLDTRTPAAWSVDGPWESTGVGTFRSGELPRGFIAAGDLATVEYDAGGTLVKSVRVDGAREPQELEGLVSAGRTYLGALYGWTPDRFHLVVAPDPMYRGGLASPFGMLLHGDVGPEVAAHELVHVHQRFQASRTPPDATVWFLEGAAVLHGALLEVVAGLDTIDEAQQIIQDAHDRSLADPGVPASAVYGDPMERAAYDQGALVIAHLDRFIQDRTGGMASLADVLSALNEDREATRISNDAIMAAVANVTDTRPTELFDRHVFGAAVPDVVDVSPRALVMRLDRTVPDPAVQGPVTVVLVARNLGVDAASLDEAVRLDGLPAGQVQVDVPVGQTRTIELDLGTLEPGSHSLTVGPWRFTLDVLRPPEASFHVRSFPAMPAQGDVLAVAVTVNNTGEAPWKGELWMLVDGSPVDDTGVVVPGGGRGLANLAAVLNASGPIQVTVETGNGTTVWTSDYDVEGARNAPGASALLAVALVTCLAALATARRRS